MGLTVLLSVYVKENPQYLKKSLDSLLNQTLLPDEIVLIEDGPLTKELYDVVEEFATRCSSGNAKVDFVVHAFKENVKLGRALEAGVYLSSNELIARMDTDDIAVNNRFEMQFRYMENHPEIAVCGGFMEEFSDEAPDYHKIKTMPENMDEIRNYARFRNPVNHMTVMFRKGAVLAAGNYKHVPLLEDYDLWSRMLAEGNQFHNLQKVLVMARTDLDIYCRRGGFDYCKRYLELRKRQKKLGLLKGKDYLVACILTMGMTLQPSFLRKQAYQKILRKKK